MKTILRLLMAATGAAAVIVVAGAVSLAQAPKFYSDDPLAREPESQDAAKVASWDIDLIPDLVINLFSTQGDKQFSRAGNVNTIDEVPDSNWFTNRIGTRAVTVEEAARGPLAGNGPAPGRYTVVGQKRSGFAPGFTMRDSAGETWFVSFDADGFPEAATGAILVANKIFWTLGYWQVENRLITIRADQLDIAETTEYRAPSGRRRPMNAGDLDDVFERANRGADGTYRAIAARTVPGRVIGGFRYYGTRPDDPNDVVPHEHRRELRALKVFGAWTNLTDMKAGNTLDTVITENGRSVVRHYLQDVGSTFGTGANAPHDWDEGWEHLLDISDTMKRLVMFGFPIRPWMTADYADNDAIGRFEGKSFDPTTWKPRVPTSAFVHARADDNFWAARRVAAFSDEMIRAMAKTGAYSNPNDEKLLADVLIERRDKIAQAYLNAVNPLVDFSMGADGRLSFRNAAVDARVATAPANGYRATWARFDNATRTATAIGDTTGAAGAPLAPPANLPNAAGTYLKVSVAAAGGDTAAAREPVDVYFRRTGNGWQLVGVERMRDN